MTQLKGRLALVTGASRGIGRQIALGLAREGCALILHARRTENLRETIGLVEAYAVPVHAVEASFSSPEAVEAMIGEILTHHGPVDILYNNAALYTKPRPIWEHARQLWEELLQVNLATVIQLCSAFAPVMKQRGYGRIVNVSTTMRGTPTYAPYIVTKNALEAYTQELALALKGSGVLVNILQPGWLRTDMGGSTAPNDVSAVLPGALVPVLLPDDGPTGQQFKALDYRHR